MWTPEALMARTVRNGDCREFVGCRARGGYGKVTFGGKTYTTHRLSWQLHNGPIPVGLCVLHTCDNPPCIEPTHLFLGTKADNTRDMHDKGRHPRRRVTPLVAREIVALRGELTQDEIARRFGIAQSTVSIVMARAA